MKNSVSKQELVPPLSQTILQSEILLARQPIFDNYHNVFGFEVLYRGHIYNITDLNDGMGATAELLNNICACVVDEKITAEHPVFINVDEKFICSPSFFPKQSNKIIFEILESVPATISIINKIKSLKRQGFEFALDDYVFASDREPFLSLVSIVKVDVLACTTEQLRCGMKTLSQYSITMLAEKVETYEMYEHCKELGFTLFQGYYLERPKLIRGTKIPANKQVTLRLLSELTRINISNKEISESILCDPRLAVKVLLLVNSSLFSFVRDVSNVQEAVIMLGVEAVKRWAIILLLVSDSELPIEIFRTLLTRAKVLELCATDENLNNVSEYFSLGLFSGIDAVLGISMQQIITSLPLSDELKAALYSNQGKMGELLLALKMIEKNRPQECNENSLKQLNSVYWQGLMWADELMDSISK